MLLDQINKMISEGASIADLWIFLIDNEDYDKSEIIKAKQYVADIWGGLCY